MLSLLTLIETCTTLQQLQQIHAKSIISGLAYSQIILTKLINSFSSNTKHLHYATLIFDRTHQPNNFICNSMIRIYSSSSSSETTILAISTYNKMRDLRESFQVDNFTFPFVFKACANLSAIEKGRETHGLVIRIGYDSDLFVQSSLLNFYSVCGEIDNARWVFDKYKGKDVVFWNAMIMGYVRNGRILGALEIFQEMLLELNEMRPNEGTILSLISACLGSKDVELGREIHGYASKRMDFTMSVKFGAAFVDFYAKCGRLDDARMLFEEMTQRNTVVWNSLICGYSQNGCPRQAINLFQEMLVSDVRPDRFTISGILSSCAQTGALNLGNWVQQFAEKNKIWDVFVGTALIDMYAKCGLITMAREVFCKMTQRNVATWNAIISGFAYHGQARNTLDLFYEMEKSESRPDSITFVSILNACAHAGLVEEGCHFFDLMVKCYKIVPKVEHYGCMVDLLGRAGLLREAKELIEKMEVEPNVIVWGALLGACSIHGDVEMGEWAAQRVLRLDPMDGGSYVLLSNVYAVGQRYDVVKVVREMMAQRRVRKAPGCSMIEVGDVVHEFVVADKAHPRVEEIYGVLDELCLRMKMEGYAPCLL